MAPLPPRLAVAAISLFVLALPLSLGRQCVQPQRVHASQRTKTAEGKPTPGNATRCSFDGGVDFSDLLDSTLLPDYWTASGGNGYVIDSRIPRNGEPPEQLVKVTDRRHRFPVFATVCSLAFLVTIIAIIVVCTN